jgi:hypothetical protein
MQVARASQQLQRAAAAPACMQTRTPVPLPLARRRSAGTRTAAVAAAPRCTRAVPSVAAPSARAAPRARRALRIRAGWGDPVAFSPAKVVSVTKKAALAPEGPALYSVLVDVGADIAAGYTRGGQYLQVKVRRPAARGSGGRQPRPPAPPAAAGRGSRARRPRRRAGPAGIRPRAKLRARDRRRAQRPGAP